SPDCGSTTRSVGLPADDVPPLLPPTQLVKPGPLKDDNFRFGFVNLKHRHCQPVFLLGSSSTETILQLHSSFVPSLDSAATECLSGCVILSSSSALSFCKLSKTLRTNSNTLRHCSAFLSCFASSKHF